MTPYFKEQLGCEGSMSQHDALTLEHCPHCGKYHTPKIVLASEHWADEYDGDYPHSERYAVMCDASSPNGPGGCGASGGFHATEDEAVASWNRRAALSATQPAQAAQSDWGAQQFKAPVYPPDGTESPFTVINLGSGKVQMGDSIHDGRLPALWFGINGQGMGHEETMNREARPGETLAVVTFANVEGLDVLLDVIQRIRREKFPEAQAAQGAGEVVSDYYPELLIARSAVQELEQKVFSLEQCKAILQASVASYQRDMVDPPAYLQDAVIKAAGLGAMAEQIAALKKQVGITQPAAGADVPDMVEIMALADSYRNATCQEATASAREWLRAAIAASGRKS